MTFIDWSDSEEMFNLLMEYIADEKSVSGDRERTRFLSGLLNEVSELNNRFASLSVTELIRELCKIYTSVDPEFKNDPVILHVRDCVEELERLKREND